MNPAEINAPPSMEQMYALYGEALAENRVLKAIIAQHPEIIASHALASPSAPNETAETATQEV
jgi:hypothetical protein